MIYLYDDNHITIDGNTNLAFTEDRGERFEAYGWHVQYVTDGNDVEAIETPFRQLRETHAPLLSSALPYRLWIAHPPGYQQSPWRAPGDEELNAAKKNLGWPLEPRFYVPDDVLAHFREAVERGAKYEADWKKRFEAYANAFPEQAKELQRRING